MLRSPAHVLTILAVGDLARSIRFYAEAFAWQPVVQVPVYVEYALPGGMRFGLYQRQAFARNTGQEPACIEAGSITSTEIYLHSTDPAADAVRLERAGARILSPLQDRDWGDEAAYLADPDGNVLVVARPLGPTCDGPEPLREVARRWVTAWQGGDTAILDEVCAPDFVDHSPSGRTPDLQGSKEGLRELYQAFPDFSGGIDDLVVEPETRKVSLRWSATGTHRSHFLGILPTGRRIRFRGIEILRVSGGRIVERWGEWDGLDLLDQLGEGAAG